MKIRPSAEGVKRTFTNPTNLCELPTRGKGATVIPRVFSALATSTTSTATAHGSGRLPNPREGGV